MSNSVNKPIYNNYMSSLFEKEGFELVVSMDCEGTNYDKNLENNVLNLERFLKLATNNNITCILFITPYFADMLSKLKLIEKIKENYKVIFGLHIHYFLDCLFSSLILQNKFCKDKYLFLHLE